MILGGLNLLCCQIFLKEIMIMITMSHDKALLILTDDAIGIKTMAMFFTVMVIMIFFIVIIMRWTWCYWCFTSQMILCRLDLFRSQIFLKEIMIMVTMGHDKACCIFTNDSICIKTMIMLLITMVPMIIFIVIIMGWTWCYWRLTS